MRGAPARKPGATPAAGAVPTGAGFFSFGFFSFGFFGGPSFVFSFCDGRFSTFFSFFPFPDFSPFLGACDFARFTPQFVAGRARQ